LIRSVGDGSAVAKEAEATSRFAQLDDSDKFITPATDYLFDTNPDKHIHILPGRLL
jgi:hypothetical protein